jgi:ribosomal protein S18 acetylase RimI-like enzyme
VITEFRRADPARELRTLIAFDHKVFRKSDWFSAKQWRTYECYWMLVNGRKAGCCAFERHKDFQDDVREDGVDPPLRGSLHIVTSGILPRYQGKGFGTLMKAWQIAFARHHRFTRMVTCSRESNRPMIGLNRKFGFRTVRTTRAYYSDPVESAVVMERLL